MFKYSEKSLQLRLFTLYQVVKFLTFFQFLIVIFLSLFAIWRHFWLCKELIYDFLLFQLQGLIIVTGSWIVYRGNMWSNGGHLGGKNSSLMRRHIGVPNLISKQLAGSVQPLRNDPNTYSDFKNVIFKKAKFAYVINKL